MNQQTRKQIMKGLKKKIPLVLGKSENFLGKKGGIWTYQITSWFYKRLPVFDNGAEYYGEEELSEIGETDPILKKMKINSIYVNGVNREIHDWLEDRGWYPQWYDRSTLFFWPYNISGFGV